MIGFELEVLARKFDRFGWQRDRGTPAQDRVVRDWMDALQDYPLEEVQRACRAAVAANPDRMPNEGHVLRQIMAARQHQAKVNRPLAPPPAQLPAPRVTSAQRQRILRENGFRLPGEGSFRGGAGCG